MKQKLNEETKSKHFIFDYRNQTSENRKTYMNIFPFLKVV